MTTPDWPGCRYTPDGMHKLGTRTVHIRHDGTIDACVHCTYGHTIENIEAGNIISIRDLTPDEIREFAQELSDRTPTITP